MTIPLFLTYWICVQNSPANGLWASMQKSNWMNYWVHLISTDLLNFDQTSYPHFLIIYKNEPFNQHGAFFFPTLTQWDPGLFPTSALISRVSQKWALFSRSIWNKSSSDIYSSWSKQRALIQRLPGARESREKVPVIIPILAAYIGDVNLPCLMGLPLITHGYQALEIWQMWLRNWSFNFYLKN